MILVFGFGILGFVVIALSTLATHH